jgi:hypothetical protein
VTKLDTLAPSASDARCLGATAAFLGPDGLVFRPMSDCTMAWEV